MATATDIEPAHETPVAALLKNAAARQFVAMVAIAASVALGVALVLWTRAPSMGPLFPNLSEAQVLEVVKALENAGILYELENGTGRVLVEKTQVDKTRMMLAGQGLPGGDDAGLEILGEEPQFGLSSLQEKMRYEHAFEVELARSISTLKGVRAARVHIARGNDSVFVRDRMPATASVILDVASGRTLPRDHVQAIVHMVSSGSRNLSPNDVTVVDQFGNLLSSPNDDDRAALSDRQFEHKQRQEAALVTKVNEMLSPTIGAGRFSTQINTVLDFTQTQETSELFDAAASTVVSQRESTNEQRAADAEGGVPGALANQPPLTGQNAPGEDGPGATVRTSSDTTTNFEPGRRIRTTNEAVGEVVRLSVAVVVDNLRSVDAEGNAESRPRTPEEIADIERMVREAVGFDAARGDTIEIVNTEFQSDGLMQPPAPPEFWQEPWFLDMVRQGIGLLFALIVFFKIVRPMARGVIQASTAALPPPAEAMALPDGGAIAIEDQSESDTSGSAQLEDAAPEPTIDERVDAARQIATEDPERVANIMKEWVGDEDG